VDDERAAGKVARLPVEVSVRRPNSAKRGILRVKSVYAIGRFQENLMLVIVPTHTHTIYHTLRRV
jgi:hypothetical protein